MNPVHDKSVFQQNFCMRQKLEKETFRVEFRFQSISVDFPALARGRSLRARVPYRARGVELVE